LITFGNQQVDTVYPVQTAPKSITAVLNHIQGGGGTPLNSALDYIAQLAKQYSQHPQTLYILTDARTHIPFKSPPLKMPITVIDMENHTIPLSKAQQLADYLQADYLSLSQLDIFT
jgi:Mg-chelatase subunit ChlD